MRTLTISSFSVKHLAGNRKAQPKGFTCVTIQFPRFTGGARAGRSVEHEFPCAVRLINARFHAVSSFWVRGPRSVSLEKLSPLTRGLGGPLHYRGSKQRSIDGYRSGASGVLCNRYSVARSLPRLASDVFSRAPRADLINDADPYAAIFR